MNQDVFVLVTMLEEDCKKTEPGLISHLGRETGKLCLETTVLCARLCCAKSLQSCPTLCYPRLAHQAPLSMIFSRQIYWSGLPCPPPGYLPNPGIKPACLMSPALAGRFFTTSSAWEALHIGLRCRKNGRRPCGREIHLTV